MIKQINVTINAEGKKELRDLMHTYERVQEFNLNSQCNSHTGQLKRDPRFLSGFGVCLLFCLIFDHFFLNFFGEF